MTDCWRRGCFGQPRADRVIFRRPDGSRLGALVVGYFRALYSLPPPEDFRDQQTTG